VSKMMHLLMQLFFPCEIIFFTSNENSRKIDWNVRLMKTFIANKIEMIV
jgi:hypothetical protein